MCKVPTVAGQAVLKGWYPEALFRALREDVRGDWAGEAFGSAPDQHFRLWEYYWLVAHISSSRAGSGTSIFLGSLPLCASWQVKQPSVVHGVIRGRRWTLLVCG